MIEAARQIIEEAWEEIRGGVSAQRALGIKPQRLADLSLTGAQRRSAVGQSLLARLAKIDEAVLPHDIALTLRLVAFRARTWAREAEWYWTVVDPAGVGLFGMFLPTAYCGGWFLSQVHSQLASLSVESWEDAEHYLTLVGDYARLIEQFAARTVGQAERGMRMPGVQVLQARRLLTHLRRNLRATLGIPEHRIRNIERQRFLASLEVCIADKVEPAFDSVLESVSDNYLRCAPDSVGLGQYPGGEAAYEELARLHTTLNLTPERIHAQGHARMEELQQQMLALRSQLGIMGGDPALAARLDRDGRWRAGTVEALSGFFGRYLERIRPRLGACFHTMPKAAFGVSPLAIELQDSMTYGYFDGPAEGRMQGTYFFNVGNLKNRSLHYLASLTYHELLPGHHLQAASQLLRIP